MSRNVARSKKYGKNKRRNSRIKTSNKEARIKLNLQKSDRNKIKY